MKDMVNVSTCGTEVVKHLGMEWRRRGLGMPWRGGGVGGRKLGLYENSLTYFQLHQVKESTFLPTCNSEEHLNGCKYKLTAQICNKKDRKR